MKKIIQICSRGDNQYGFFALNEDGSVSKIGMNGSIEIVVKGKSDEQ